MIARLISRAWWGRRRDPPPPLLIEATPDVVDVIPQILPAAADSRSGSRPAAARRSRHPDPVHVPLAAHVAALQTWAADVERLPDGAVLASELTAAYREMCGEHNWIALHWDLVAAALRAEARLSKRYAWVATEAGAKRLCVYDLPLRPAAPGVVPRPNFKAAKAAVQARHKGRFVKNRSQRRAA